MFKLFNSSTSNSVTSGGGGGGDKNIASMGSTRELQHALQQRDLEIKAKDARISLLEQEIKKKDNTIRNLNRELDKYRSVLQPTQTNTKGGRQRLQGISAEPQSLSKSQALSSAELKRHSKSDK